MWRCTKLYEAYGVVRGITTGKDYEKFSLGRDLAQFAVGRGGQGHGKSSS